MTESIRQKGYIVVQDTSSLGTVFGFFEDELEANEKAESELTGAYSVLVIPAVRFTRSPSATRG